MYRNNARVRYSEVGLNKQVNMNQIVNYFQDCSSFQSEDIGAGLAYLEEEKKAWWLSSWQIEMERFPEFNEEISIGTWPYDFKGIYGYRNYDIVDANGIQIARANSIWVHMDLEKGRPTKIAEQYMKVYPFGERLQMEYSARKIEIPENFIEEKPFFVLKAHLDTNCHVNNGKYVEFAEEYLPKDKTIKSMRADYKKAAKWNDRIVPRISDLGNEKYVIQLCEENGNPYVILEYVLR